MMQKEEDKEEDKKVEAKDLYCPRCGKMLGEKEIPPDDENLMHETIREAKVKHELAKVQK